MRLGAAVLGLAVAAAAAPAQAQPQAQPPTYAQRWAALCANCHGSEGVSTTPDTPSLAGQPAFYAATQLFLFRAGRRTNAAMTAVASTLSDDDLRGFSDLIGRLPDASLPPAADADAARMARARDIARRNQCTQCHGADLAGGAQVPRLAGQREDYLRRVLREFKQARRVGYTQAMNEALVPASADELDLLAYFLSRVR
ncbi:MAG TPA: c-type cytochrome [Ramlibacter sp.]|uniref:c-type cytochrome n=1 Tax=Ramlibacter sp. TaxID=1917967 RepID=UPI002B586FB6|nr:c-type cytochrome [Ramlibacter sp.]HVZ46387.1 c-type cytochrome [Ramlibacter sp.]